MHSTRCSTPPCAASRCWCASAQAGSPSPYGTPGPASLPTCCLGSSNRSSPPRNPAQDSVLDWPSRRRSSGNSAVRSLLRIGPKAVPNSRSNLRASRSVTMSDGISVLLIEDDTAVRIGSVQALQLAGFTVESFESAERAVPHIRAGMPAVVVTDVKLPGMDGLGLLRCAADIEADLPVILVTGHGDVAMAVQAMRAGAYDFIEKPFPSELLVEVVARAAEKRQLTLEVSSLRNRLQHCVGIEAALLGRSPAMEQVRRTILDLADTSANVVINGETGTGKELVARSLHEHSSRRNGRFVAVNCGGLPEQLFESEIFGHELGAFTGANKRRIGKFEWANGGTMFLDEVESLPMSLQVKLLRVLQERKVERLGSNELIPLDCRVIAASQEDIGELVKRQRFRSDLYYRLNVAVIELPPLRERREDIPI